MIQRFGSALNLNVHLHMLFLDGVYVDNKYRSALRFQWIKSPTGEELTKSTHTLAKRIGRFFSAARPIGVAAKAHERKKLERICRYIARLPVSEQHLSITRTGRVRYELKTPWRDGTTHVIFEPLDFMSKLAGLVPKPRVNLTRFHGVFAPNSRHRARVTPTKRGKGKKLKATESSQDKSPEERRASMTCTRGHKGATLKARFRY